MSYAGQIIRLFISSTFHDLHAERNVLQEKVFPKLHDFCRSHGARFQAIDLRWGVSQEASDDQRTLIICLDEARRCRAVSPDVNFLVLLGQRYGSLFLPPIIDAEEFTTLLPYMKAADQDLVKVWYRRDENALPPTYVLQPRHGDYLTDHVKWTRCEKLIQNALKTACKRVPLVADSALRYIASATEQEINEGVFLPDRHDALCFFRTIQGVPGNAEGIEEYIDPPGSEEYQQLANLKRRLRKQCRGSVFDYNAQWGYKGCSDVHLASFCRLVEEQLTQRVEQALSHASVTFSIASPQHFLDQRMRYFTGRQNTISDIGRYLAGNSPYPFLLTGPSGSGKTMVMESMAQYARQKYPEAVIQKVFIGLTPDITSTRALLAHLNDEIALQYPYSSNNKPEEQLVATEEGSLIYQFQTQLKQVTADRPLFVFIDALDQLRDQGQEGRWLPLKLPDHVRLVISTLSGEEGPDAGVKALQERYPQASIIDLEKQPLSVEEARSLLTAWLEFDGNDGEGAPQIGQSKPARPAMRRTLQPEQMNTVLDGFVRAGSLPLYLRLAYEEARRWASYDTPSDLRLPLPSNISDLLKSVFTRLSEPRYHGEALVAHALGYLGAARNGLAEDEIVAILSRDRAVMAEFRRNEDEKSVTPSQDSAATADTPHNTGEKDSNTQTLAMGVESHANEERKKPKPGLYFSSPATDKLPVVIWSRLYFDLEPYLTELLAHGTRLINFYHRLLREVVSQTYLLPNTADDRHRALARYFMDEDLTIGNEPNLRKLSEQPYQQTQAKMFDEAYETLTDFHFLEQKAAIGRTQRQLLDRQVIEIYTGVYELQEDFRLLLDALQGNKRAGLS